MAPGPLADMGPAPKLSLNALTAGRGRLDACRWVGGWVWGWDWVEGVGVGGVGWGGGAQ